MVEGKVERVVCGWKWDELRRGKEVMGCGKSKGEIYGVEVEGVSEEGRGNGVGKEIEWYIEKIELGKGVYKFGGGRWGGKEDRIVVLVEGDRKGGMKVERYGSGYNVDGIIGKGEEVLIDKFKDGEGIVGVVVEKGLLKMGEE